MPSSDGPFWRNRQVAWQIFDKHGAARLHGEYRVKQSARTKADTIEALVAQLDGMKRRPVLRPSTLSTRPCAPTFPTIPARRMAAARKPCHPKSNWALAIAEPPFEAYAVTCGITFTFGGLRVDATAACSTRAASASRVFSPR
jgi:tricarballylate dehydrogenase